MAWHKRWLSYISLRVQTYLGLEARRVLPRPGHRTVAVSGLIADQLKQAYGPELISPVIPPGVIQPDLKTINQRQLQRKALGYSDEDKVCLLVARNPLRKGLTTVLNALELLPPEYKLLVVGSNAASKDHIFRSSRYQRLTDRIQLIPITSDVTPYYSAADIYVHPTLNDSFGMAPLEAMSFKVPVIISPSPWCGFAQYVQDGHSAMVLSHPENSTQLAQFIQLLGTDAALCQHLVSGANQVVEQHSWVEIARQFGSLYDQVLKEKETV